MLSAMLNAEEIDKLFAESPAAADKKWALKIEKKGLPPQVLHSDSVFELWTVLRAISSLGITYCRFVEIFGRNGHYGKTFDGQLTMPFCSSKQFGAELKSAIEAEKDAMRVKASVAITEEEDHDLDIF